MGIPYLDRQSLYQDGPWALTSFNMISIEHSTPSFSPLAANITLCRETGCRSVFLVSELPSTLAVPVDTTTSKFTEELVLSFRPSLGLQVGHGLMSSGRLCYLMDWKRTAYVMHSEISHHLCHSQQALKQCVKGNTNNPVCSVVTVCHQAYYMYWGHYLTLERPSALHTRIETWCCYVVTR